MTLRHMRIFAEVYRTRNVTHAGRRHVVAWHKEKYLTASMRRFITLCRSAAEKVGKAVNFIVKGRTMCAPKGSIAI